MTEAGATGERVCSEAACNGTRGMIHGGFGSAMDVHVA